MGEMDSELAAARASIKLALQALEARRKRLENTRSKLSRHYNRVQHTAAMIGLLEQVAGVLLHDPDLWDDEPDSVPF